MRGCVLLIEQLIQSVFQLALLVAVIAGLAALLSSEDETGILVGLVGAALLALFLVWRLLIRPLRRGLGRKTVPATILRIDHRQPFGAPAHHWTFVLFEARGERITLRLTARQALTFEDEYSAGDTGMLTYSGNRMFRWEPPTPDRPLVNARHRSVFVSYSHQWSEDAIYIAEFLQKQGLSVWLDREQLRVGDRLNDRIRDAIQRAHYFVPLLSQDYWMSHYCIQEFEQAVSSGKRILPIKVDPGPNLMPPHIRQLYNQALAEPIYLDLRGRNPVRQLKDLAQQMTAGR